jgi:hypothetical protein
MRFIFCIVDDYAKTAINTSILTGKTIGVCTMVYGLVTTNVPSFVNYARRGTRVAGRPGDRGAGGRDDRHAGPDVRPAKRPAAAVRRTTAA